MDKRYFILSVRGKEHNWCFTVLANKEHWQEWLDDGIDIQLLVNNIPEWVVNLGLLKIWCFLQDLGFLKP